MRKLFFTVLAGLALQSVVIASAAADQVVEKPVVADTPAKFSQTADSIRAEMNTGGRYEFIAPADKTKAQADLDSIAAMLQKFGSVSAMNQSQQVALFNVQEHLNGLLTHSDRNRLICERRLPMGSNIPLTTCKTVADVEKNRRDSQKYLLDHDKDANINSAAINRHGG